jgi:hypothetical protein
MIRSINTRATTEQLNQSNGAIYGAPSPRYVSLLVHHSTSVQP